MITQTRVVLMNNELSWHIFIDNVDVCCYIERADWHSANPEWNSRQYHYEYLIDIRKNWHFSAWRWKPYCWICSKAENKWFKSTSGVSLAIMISLINAVVPVKAVIIASIICWNKAGTDLMPKVSRLHWNKPLWSSAIPLNPHQLLKSVR